MSYSCIYMILSKVSPDKVYIGSAKDWHDRKWRHSRELVLNKHSNNKLQNHVNKYGIEDLIFVVVEKIFDKSLLIPREQFYIDNIKPWFNIKMLAGSNLGYKHTEETKKKISKGNKGKKVSESSKKIISEKATGRKWTEEQKKAFSIKRTGMKLRPVTEETRMKMRLAQLGNKNNIKGWITRRAKNVA